MDAGEADDDAQVALELEPGGHVRVVVEPRHQDLVAGRQRAGERPRQQEVERRHARPECDLARVAPEEAPGGVVRSLDESDGANARAVRRAGVRVVGAQVAGDRVDHLVRALRAARSVEERHRPVERRESCPHRVHVQVCADGHSQNLHSCDDPGRARRHRLHGAARARRGPPRRAAAAAGRSPARRARCAGGARGGGARRGRARRARAAEGVRRRRGRRLVCRAVPRARSRSGSGGDRRGRALSRHDGRAGVRPVAAGARSAATRASCCCRRSGSTTCPGISRRGWPPSRSTARWTSSWSRTRRAASRRAAAHGARSAASWRNGRWPGRTAGSWTPASGRRRAWSASRSASARSSSGAAPSRSRSPGTPTSGTSAPTSARPRLRRKPPLSAGSRLRSSSSEPGSAALVPSDASRRKSRFVVVAEATGAGGSGRAVLSGSDVYGLTALLIVRGAEALSAGEARGAGVLAPAEAFDARTLVGRLDPLLRLET